MKFFFGHGQFCCGSNANSQLEENELLQALCKQRFPAYDKQRGSVVRKDFPCVSLTKFIVEQELFWSFTELD
jgi:hypothetical protein